MISTTIIPAPAKDGNGELPKDFWETYCAFANSDGGDILLGIAEEKGHFQLGGINNVTKVMDDLWNLANNPQKVSTNILKQQYVQELHIEGKTIIRVHVPRATRRRRPVFIGGNPISGTYTRQHSGDYRCDEETVRRMLAEQVEDSRDNEILFGYGMEDLDLDSFNAYRQLYASRQSGPSVRMPEGWLTVQGLDKPLIDRMEFLREQVRQELIQDACIASEKKRLFREEMEPIILGLCRDYYLTLPVLCRLLQRQPDPLRKQYLKPLVERGALALAFPTTPTHPQQAYTATL